MSTKTKQLRTLLASGEFSYMPSATTPIEGKLAETAGAKLVYTVGYATGATRAISEPLLTMDEQVHVAGEVARAVTVPLVADAGAGFGEPLHTMRTVREFAAAGVAGIHIEDQLFPKRAHYHKYVAHAVPLPEFVDKIRWACRERDRIDSDFVIIARSDTCREFGLDEAIARVNAAAEVGADLGLVFPRNDSEAAAAPKRAKLPLVWVQSPATATAARSIHWPSCRQWGIAPASTRSFSSGSPCTSSRRHWPRCCRPAATPVSATTNSRRYART